MSTIRAVVTDIEGTTSSISFVKDVLFPYARARMADYVASGGPGLEDVPGPDRLATLLAWMDADAKETALKAIQGRIWREGFESGALKGHLYPDTAPALRRWAARGLRLYVYSSGSEEAQRLLFGHSAAGDLTGLFAGFYDTRIGAKREAASYAAIARAIGLPADATLFLSDVAAELDAAAQAGFVTCQLLRPEDGAVPGAHAQEADFDGVERRFAL